MTRDLSFNWHSAMTCEWFSVRDWKFSPSFVPFSTASSNFIWADLGTYSSSVFSLCWLEILYCRFWRRVVESTAQRTTIFSILSWSVTVWKLTWLWAAEIGDPWVYFAVTSEGAAGAENRVLFCLPDSSDAFLSYIIVSLSWSTATETRRSQGC